MPSSLTSILTALQQPTTYPHACDEIVHLETHISHVFLAGEFAYKLKKPVDFGFLDFTTLEKRRAACAEEVRLNARLAADIYLGVVTVCGSEAGYRVRPIACTPGEGEDEVLVHMRRFPQEGLLDQQAKAGRLTPAIMTDIAHQLAHFHSTAARGPQLDIFGNVDSVRGPVMQNFTQTVPYIGRTVSAATHARLHAWAEEFLRSHVELFSERVRGGKIVDGHGDLHLRNMCLYGASEELHKVARCVARRKRAKQRNVHAVHEHAERFSNAASAALGSSSEAPYHGRVLIFDCIEFNPALRAGDVMNDIAFLIMDLDHRALVALANRFLNEYLVQTNDYAGLKLLDFYRVYRACVRAKVMSFESDVAAASERHTVEQEAAAYFTLAEQMLAAPAPGLLITCGVSGSGKTTLARQVCETLDGVMVRSDAVRKHLAGLTLTSRGQSSGTDISSIYSAEMTARTYAALLRHAREIIASGRWAILDAVYAKKSERVAAAALARELGVPFGILHCVAPQAELVRRLDQRAAEGSDISEATLDTLAQQLRYFATPSLEEGPQFSWSGQEDPAQWLESLHRKK